MRYTELKPGVYYCVVRGNAQMKEGDRVRLDIHGDLEIDGDGWYLQRQLKDACLRVCFMLDTQYYNNRRRVLEEELIQIDRILREDLK